MRNLYFIRHGDVEMPGGQRRCVGASDYPLSALGRLRAVLLAPGFDSRELGEVFVSPLSRARETAELMGARGVALPASIYTLDQLRAALLALAKGVAGC